MIYDLMSRFDALDSLLLPKLPSAPLPPSGELPVEEVIKAI